MPIDAVKPLMPVTIDEQRGTFLENMLCDTRDPIHVFGLGTFGGNLSLIKYLAGIGHKVIVWESRREVDLEQSWSSIESVHDQIEMHWDVRLPQTRKTDKVFTSPALQPDHPWLKKLSPENIFTEMELSLFHLAKRETLTHVVMGSVGKSTCASLFSHALQCPLYGNIGCSPLKHILTINIEIILELSSYQLHYLKPLDFKPSSFFVTPIADNHIKWHGGLNKYHRAKLDWVEKWENIVPGTNMNKLQITDHIDSIALLGRHNVMNANAVLDHIFKFKKKDAALIENIKQFKGLPHRLEVVDTSGDCRIINDSKATSPSAVLTALDCIRPQSTLILHGYSPEFNYQPLYSRAEELSLYLILIHFDDSAAPSDSTHPGLQVSRFNNLKEAFKEHAILPKSGMDILFSPGAPSYSQYDNYESRGEDFKNLVSQYLLSD